MPFSSNSTVCVSFGCLIDLSPIMDCVFLFLCMVDNFLSDARHCEFYTIGYWIILYPYDYFELCSGTQFSYLERILNFGIMFLRFF